MDAITQAHLFSSLSIAPTHLKLWAQQSLTIAATHVGLFTLLNSLFPIGA